MPPRRRPGLPVPREGLVGRARRRGRHRRRASRGRRRGDGGPGGVRRRARSSRSATTPTRTAPSPSSRTATARPGAGRRSRTGRGRSSATTNTHARRGGLLPVLRRGCRRSRARASTRYDAGTWRIYVLNSNCARGRRLRGRLGAGAVAARRPRRRTRAPASPRCGTTRASAPASTADHDVMADLWRTLQDAGAELVLAGHDHSYERFGPQDAAGRADERGLVELVVGTGGRDPYAFRRPAPQQPRPREPGLRRLAPPAPRWLVRLRVPRGPGRRIHRPRQRHLPLNPSERLGADQTPRRSR